MQAPGQPLEETVLWAVRDPSLPLLLRSFHAEVAFFAGKN